MRVKSETGNLSFFMFSVSIINVWLTYEEKQAVNDLMIEFILRPCILKV